jgi:hypothetical protein
MAKIIFIKKITNLLAALTLVIGLLPATRISSVFADDGVSPAAVETNDSNSTEADSDEGSTSTPEATVAETSQPAEADLGVEVTETEAAESKPTEEMPTGEGLTTETPVLETPTAALVVAETTQATSLDEVNEVAAASSEDNVTAEESLSEVISYLNEQNVVLENDSEEAISLSSNEAIEVLTNSDPFFWNPGTLRWEGYSVDGTSCPANVTCFADANPFQAAVNAAPSGATVYVAQNTYDEDVVINTQNLSFVSFSSINVEDAGTALAPTLISGYSSIKSLTLNVDFGTTLGVYADTVIVNSGGKLDDGLNLVNIDGTVEASVIIYSADGHYRVQDANDASINYEWECGEPDTLIYPGRVYRMVLKGPMHPDILNYYENIGDDTGLGRSTVERIDDLLEGVKRSETESWSHTNEERIFWYLLGQVGNNNGAGANGTTTILNSTQLAMATAILNRASDTEMGKLGIWFLWPILENSGTDVSPLTRQLTFMHYMTTEVYGCTNLSALNYNPVANTDDGSCRFDTPDDPSDPGDPGDGGGGGGGTTTVTTAFIPVTAQTAAGGPTEELFLIPVTGVDNTSPLTSWQRLFFSASAMLFGISLVLEGARRKTIH